MKCFLRIFFILQIFLLTQGHAQGQNIAPEQATLLGDQQMPFMLFSREILSTSQDILECVPQDDLQPVFKDAQENRQFTLDEVLSRPSATVQTELPSFSSRRSSNIESENNLLLGFPLVALNQSLAIGGTIIDFSDSGNEFYQHRSYQSMFSAYKHAILGVKEVQIKLVGLQNGGCSLRFAICFHPGLRERGCIENIGNFTPVQIPVLGISPRHQSVIVDLNTLGKSLNSRKHISSFKPHEPIRFTGYNQNHLSLGFPNLPNPKTSIVDFSDSTLIFDVSSQMHWRSEPFPQMKVRWFMKFNILNEEETFIKRPPVNGLIYNMTQEGLIQLYEDIFILEPSVLHWRIVKNNQINTKHFYIKKMPPQYHEPVAQAFEYWNSLFVSQANKFDPALASMLEATPLLSYTFIPDDYDGEQEIVTSDIRFNVLEWIPTTDFYAHTGIASKFFNEYTGEIWSSTILLKAQSMIESLKMWFQIGQTIRNGNMDKNTPFISRMPPANISFDQFAFNILKFITAHEIGHALGFEHNYRGSVFAQNNYGNSVMDSTHSVIYSKSNYEQISSSVYDEMLVAYSYFGASPHRTDIFCLASNIVRIPTQSHHVELIERNPPHPECNAMDVGRNPLEYFFLTLYEEIDLLTTLRPVDSRPYKKWNRPAASAIENHIFGILAYYVSADRYYDQLESVLINGRKPQSPQELKDFVLNNYIKPLLCHPKIETMTQRYHHHTSNGTFDQQPLGDRSMQEYAFAFKSLISRFVYDFVDAPVICDM